MSTHKRNVEICSKINFGMINRVAFASNCYLSFPSTMKAGATGVKTGGGGALIFLVHCMKSPLCRCCVLRVATLPPSFEPSLRRRNLSDDVVGPLRTRFERGVVFVSIIKVKPDLKKKYVDYGSAVLYFD